MVSEFELFVFFIVSVPLIPILFAFATWRESSKVYARRAGNIFLSLGILLLVFWILVGTVSFTKAWVTSSDREEIRRLYIETAQANPQVDWWLDETTKQAVSKGELRMNWARRWPAIIFPPTAGSLPLEFQLRERVWVVRVWMFDRQLQKLGMIDVLRLLFDERGHVDHLHDPIAGELAQGLAA